MGSRDPRVDAYIAKSADFAKPILRHLRRAVHSGCPDVEETMKWSFPHFDFHGMFCSMAAFQQHCTFGFWKARHLAGVPGWPGRGGEAMGNFGRITSLRDLPSKTTLLRIIAAAAALNAADTQSPRRRSRPPAEVSGARTVRARKRPPPRAPAYFMTALRKNPAALKTFQAFSPSHQREYVDWVTEAKREETRERRLAQAIAQMAEGKPHNWKYQRS